MSDAPKPTIPTRIRGTLDLREAAALAKCHADTLRKMARDGEVPATKIGRSWVFSVELLQDWIDARCRAACGTRSDDLMRPSGSPLAAHLAAQRALRHRAKGAA